MANSETHRQLLVRCRVRNRDAEFSVRFVEHSLYRLWQYMMANKHDIVVADAAVCLWLPEAELQAQSRLFEQAGKVDEVRRISFAIYDPDTGFCNTLQRFVAVEDSERVQQLLLNRIPSEAKRAGDFAMELESGFTVLRDSVKDLTSLGHTLTEIS
ncbi:MAG: hypothetical protein OES38_03280 [Gammaproteobacteria bacterium]|nr:hypothetical protein [Gammaproteobacteria bacterium]